MGRLPGATRCAATSLVRRSAKARSGSSAQRSQPLAARSRSRSSGPSSLRPDFIRRFEYEAQLIDSSIRTSFRSTWREPGGAYSRLRCLARRRRARSTSSGSGSTSFASRRRARGAPQQIDSARAAGGEALDLWRGTAFGESADEARRGGARGATPRRHRATRSSTSGPTAPLQPLEGLVKQHSLRERFHGRSCSRDGRGIARRTIARNSSISRPALSGAERARRSFSQATHAWVASLVARLPAQARSVQSSAQRQPLAAGRDQGHPARAR